MSKSKTTTFVPAKDAAKILEISLPLCQEYMRRGVFETAYKRHGTRWVADIREVMRFKKQGIPAAGVFSKKGNG